jgi:uncharacterized protein (DUF302 family)
MRAPARRARAISALSFVFVLVLVGPGLADAREIDAQEVGPYPGTLSWQTDYGFRELIGRLQRAITSNGLDVVAVSEIEPTDHEVPANTVFLVTQRDAAERILRADSLAAMEIPIKIYVTDGPNHHAVVIYRTPTSIFALYDNKELDAIAGELDQVFAKIIDDSVSG